MAGRDPLTRADPAISLPAFERLATPPPPDLVGSAIERHTGPGDVVVDLHGRGGWVARAAVDRQRRAVTIESNPLTRLLAEIVLRPPDVRHLDAAFQAIAAAPRQESSLKISIGELFGTRCATCGRAAVVDEFIWEASPGDAEPDAGLQRPPPGRLARKHYRCSICRDQLGGGEQRHAPVDDDDLARATVIDADGPVRRQLHERFPTLDGHDALVDQLLGLHTPRQLVGLHAILQRIDADLRSASVEAVVRLGTPTAYRALETEARDLAGTSAPRPRVRLVLGQPPQRPNQDRLSFAYLATAWLLGREAAALLPLEALFGPGGRAPWGWQAAALRRSLSSIEPWLARDGRVVLLLEAGGP